MFHGGTNFGFFAGGNGRGDAPFIDGDITSYGTNIIHSLCEFY